MITPQDVESIVAKISGIADDDEAAHSAEDRLYRTVLEAIATGACSDPQACAAAALKTAAMDFSRYCA